MKTHDPESVAMDALLKAHPEWGLRAISISMALRSRNIPAAVKLAYLDVTKSLTPDDVAAYRVRIKRSIKTH